MKGLLGWEKKWLGKEMTRVRIRLQFFWSEWAGTVLYRTQGNRTDTRSSSDSLRGVDGYRVKKHITTKEENRGFIDSFVCRIITQHASRRVYVTAVDHKYALLQRSLKSSKNQATDAPMCNTMRPLLAVAPAK